MKRPKGRAFPPLIRRSARIKRPPARNTRRSYRLLDRPSTAMRRLKARWVRLRYRLLRYRSCLLTYSTVVHSPSLIRRSLMRQALRPTARRMRFLLLRRVSLPLIPHRLMKLIASWLRPRAYRLRSRRSARRYRVRTFLARLSSLLHRSYRILLSRRAFTYRSRYRRIALRPRRLLIT